MKIEKILGNFPILMVDMTEALDLILCIPLLPHDWLTECIYNVLYTLHSIYAYILYTMIVGTASKLEQLQIEESSCVSTGILSIFSASSVFSLRNSVRCSALLKMKHRPLYKTKGVIRRRCGLNLSKWPMHQASP